MVKGEYPKKMLSLFTMAIEPLINKSTINLLHICLMLNILTSEIKAKHIRQHRNETFLNLKHFITNIHFPNIETEIKTVLQP